MKIEQKHNSKIPAYAAGAALVASTVLMTSCRLAGEATSTTTPEPQIDGDVVMVTEVSETCMPVTRKYLENVSKNYTLEELQSELGSYHSYTNGKYYSWTMDDGSSAQFSFGEDGRISSIYIDGDERILIYSHDDSAAIGAVLLDFFTSFETSDYESMKKYCTMNCFNDYFHENDVNGMISAKLTSSEDIKYKYTEDDMLEAYVFVTVDMEPSSDSALVGETSTSFYVVLRQTEDIQWKIKGFTTSL